MDSEASSCVKSNEKLDVAGPSTQRPQRLVRVGSIDADSAIEDLLLECLGEDCNMLDFDSDDTDGDPNFELESTQFRHRAGNE